MANTCAGIRPGEGVSFKSLSRWAITRLAKEEREMVEAAVTLVEMKNGRPAPAPRKRKHHPDGDDPVEEAVTSTKRRRTPNNENEVVREAPILHESQSLNEREGVPQNSKRTTKASSGKPNNTRNSKGDAPVKTKEDQILHNVRDALTARSKEKTDYQAFGDAICPDNGPDVHLPVFSEEQEERMKKPSHKPSTKTAKATGSKGLGDPGDLHPSEVALCDRLGLDYGSYRCQKSRIFLGIAICIEFYRRRLDQEPTFKARNIGVSQAQVFGNIDVNITSSVMRAFQFWNWIPTIVGKHPDRKGCFVVSRDCLDRFPEDHRLELLQEVAMYEEEMHKTFAAHDVLL